MQRCLSKVSKNLHDASRLLCVGHMEISILSNQDDVDLIAIFQVLAISGPTFWPANFVFDFMHARRSKKLLARVVKQDFIIFVKTTKFLIKYNSLCFQFPGRLRV